MTAMSAGSQHRGPRGIIDNGDRKSWDQRAPMTIFFYFQNKLRHPDVIYPR